MRWSEFQQWLASTPRAPLVMGVVNVTPDSFSDGGLYGSAEAAAEHALQLVADGADLIDIGGESTRPASQRTSADEQIARVAPVLERLAGCAEAVISIDTTLAPVARAALERGAQVVNDISAGLDDPDILPLAAEHGAAVILMHMQGQPETMQVAPAYGDVVQEIRAFLARRLEAAVAAGVARERLLVDPGIGFGKTTGHNLQILRRLEEFSTLGRPLVLGTSRKGFIGRITGEAEPSRRLMGTAATVAWGVARGADIVRVHDVAEMSRVVRMVQAIRSS